MKNTRLVSLLAALSFTTAAVAADTYQVTGPVVEVSDKKIVVEKGNDKERHEFIRGADTKVSGDLKVGAKVTVRYSMTATSVEVKDK